MFILHPVPLVYFPLCSTGFCRREQLHDPVPFRLRVPVQHGHGLRLVRAVLVAVHFVLSLGHQLHVLRVRVLPVRGGREQREPVRAELLADSTRILAVRRAHHIKMHCLHVPLSRVQVGN